jgi:thioredoxin reductase (NADPH)
MLGRGGDRLLSSAVAVLASARDSRHVHMLVRSDGLAESMSQYLIRRIQDTPNITLHTRTQLTALEGSDRLERVSWMHRNGEPATPDLRHVFLMTGAQPHTRWLQGCVVLDDLRENRTRP